MRNLSLYLTLGALSLLVGLVADANPQAPESQPAPLTIQTMILATGRAGNAYSYTVAVSGGTKPYKFAATGVPAGLELDAETGNISGDPLSSAVGWRTVSVKVTDSTKPAMLTASKSLSLPINLPASKEVCGQLNVGPNANLHGFLPFGAGSAWNTDISNAPLDPDNATIVSTPGFAGNHLHPDFSGPDYGNAGIPYVVTDSSSQPLVPIGMVDAYTDESDIAVAPYPVNALIEGYPPDCAAGGWPSDYQGDAHVLVIDRNTCFLYETFNTHRCQGKWNAEQETVWDLTKAENRPWGWTSADAAGLSILAGLLKYDEVASGSVNHAIRFTMEHTKDDSNDGYFVEPASHAAGNIWGVPFVMGMRVRLKASFDISGFSKMNQAILTAMKKYGMILADNGGYFFFQGAPDPRWNDNDLDNLKSIDSSNFEVVKMTPGWPGWDSGTAPTGAPPAIHTFAASATGVKAGTAVTLSWSATGDSYDFIDKVGGVRGGSVIVHPTATTTYTLNATNQYGRSTAKLMVRVE